MTGSTRFHASTWTPDTYCNEYTKHGEVAKLDPVPFPIEAARRRHGLADQRAGARSSPARRPRLATRRWSGRYRRPSLTSAPPTSVRPDHRVQPGAFGEPLSREFRSLLDRVPPADTDEVHKLFVEELGEEPKRLFKTSRTSRSPRHRRAGTLRNLAQRRRDRRQDPAARHSPSRRRRPADPQARRAARRLRLTGSPAVGSGRRRRLRRQPRRGTGLRLEAQSIDAWVAHMHAHWAESGCRRSLTAPARKC